MCLLRCLFSCLAVASGLSARGAGGARAQGARAQVVVAGVVLQDRAASAPAGLLLLAARHDSGASRADDGPGLWRRRNLWCVSCPARSTVSDRALHPCRVALVPRRDLRILPERLRGCVEQTGSAHHHGRRRHSNEVRLATFCALSLPPNCAHALPISRFSPKVTAEGTHLVAWAVERGISGSVKFVCVGNEDVTNQLRLGEVAPVSGWPLSTLWAGSVL